MAAVSIPSSEHRLRAILSFIKSNTCANNYRLVNLPGFAWFSRSRQSARLCEDD